MNYELELAIVNGSTFYFPAIEDGITWELEKSGVPGRLCFSVVKDENLDFQEGNVVTLKYNDKPLFYGFVFSKRRSRENVISVTAYDQLRYFKNKDTYQYKNKTASELVKMIADDFGLTTGELDDTKYVIGARIEENKTLFDIVKTALDLTHDNTKKMFTLYDDFGKLCLKNTDNMILEYMVCSASAEDFDYSSSIDGETYNVIKLLYENKETKKGEYCFSYDEGNIKAWGVLQYYDEIKNKENPKAKADMLLSIYNKKARTLSINKALGDISVRAGSIIPVSLNLGDVDVNNYMMVQKVKHNFEGGYHTMDLTLKGGDFVA